MDLPPSADPIYDYDPNSSVLYDYDAPNPPETFDDTTTTTTHAYDPAGRRFCKTVGRASTHSHSHTAPPIPKHQYDSPSTHYNRHRYYDPGMGRYLNVDPIGQRGGVNVYGYAVGDPVNLGDPLGLATQYYFSVTGVAFGGPWFIGPGAGMSGGMGISISVPDNFNPKCFQMGLFSTASGLVGVGTFFGVGLSGGVTAASDGPMPSGMKTTTSMTVEANGGVGLALGGALSSSEADIRDYTTWDSKIDGATGTVFPRVGAGFGAMAAVGENTTTQYWTPTYAEECECAGQ